MNLKTHLSIAAAALAGWAVLEGIKHGVGPGKCRWCDRNERGFDTLNPLDRTVRNAAKADNPLAADWASHIIGFGATTAGALAVIMVSALAESRPPSRKWRRLLEDITVLVEAVGLASVFYQISALATGRPRPYAHFGMADRDRPWDNLSFFSGHVTYSFAVSTAATTLLWMRKSKLTPLVLGLGLAISLTCGYLRIAADKHYFTDVVTGAAVGTLVGWAVPWVSAKTARFPRFGAVLSRRHGGFFVGKTF